MSTMVKCLLCGREFKNEAGLSGHIRMAHPAAVSVDGHIVEERLEKLEYNVKFLRELIEAMSPLLTDLAQRLTPDLLLMLMLIEHLRGQHRRIKRR